MGCDRQVRSKFATPFLRAQVNDRAGERGTRRCDVFVGNRVVQARVHLGPLDASEVSVELFEGPIEADDTKPLESGTVTRLEPASREGETGIFRLTHRKPQDENLGYTVRVRPVHRDLAHPNDMGLVVWWGERSREARRYTPAS